MANIGGRSIIDAVAGTTVTVTIDPSVQHTIARWTAAQNVTVNISGVPVDGQELTLIVTNDSLLGRLLTLGTGLLGNGTALGIVSKRSVITLVADGGVFYERCRTIGI